MPLYEYYCEPCNGIFEAIRQMRDASSPAPCPVCDGEGQRVMSAFNAFTFRDGYPRRIPDKGTYWHMGREVKQRAKRMKGWEHPELAKPQPKPTLTRGERTAKGEQIVAQRGDVRYKDKWGLKPDGFRSMKARKPTKNRKTI
jgi:putative FmdB family regulatory protein